MHISGSNQVDSIIKNTNHTISEGQGCPRKLLLKCRLYCFQKSFCLVLIAAVLGYIFSTYKTDMLGTSANIGVEIEVKKLSASSLQSVKKDVD